MTSKFDIQFFGGGKGGSTSSTQYRKRDPEEQELTDLRKGLYKAIMPNLESYDPSKWGAAQEIADSSLQKQGDLLGSIESFINTNTGKSDSIIDKMMGLAESGNVSQSLMDNATASVNRGLQTGMGGMLNSLGNRGVLNSSITGQGISRLGQQAANSLQDNYLNIFNSQLGGYGQALQGAQGNLTAGTQGLLGAANAYGGMGTQAFTNAGAQLMPAYNMWKDAQTLYNGHEDFDTVVNQSKGKK